MEPPLFLQRKVPFAKRTKAALPVREEVRCPVFWGYTRVSDPKQAGNTSTETQPLLIRQEFDKKWTDTHEFGEIVADVDSASKLRFDQREGGKKLLAKMVKGDVLVITKVDRFSRSVVDGLQEMRDIWRKGIIVICLDMGGWQITFDSITGQIYFFMLLFGAEVEAKRKSERAKEAWDRQKATGTYKRSTRKVKSRSVYGTKRGPHGKRVPAPEWRAFVRSLMAAYLFGVEKFQFTKADARHQWLAEKYNLLWWSGYAFTGTDGEKKLIAASYYLLWFKREMALQEQEAASGKTYDPVPEPWRADWEAGNLHPPDHPGFPEWMKPINAPGGLE